MNSPVPKDWRESVRAAEGWSTFNGSALRGTGDTSVRSPDVGGGTLNLATALKTDEAEYRRRTVRGEPQQDDIVMVREGPRYRNPSGVTSGRSARTVTKRALPS